MWNTVIIDTVEKITQIYHSPGIIIFYFVSLKEEWTKRKKKKNLEYSVPHQLWFCIQKGGEAPDTYISLCTQMNIVICSWKRRWSTLLWFLYVWGRWCGFILWAEVGVMRTNHPCCGGDVHECFSWIKPTPLETLLQELNLLMTRGLRCFSDLSVFPSV